MLNNEALLAQLEGLFTSNILSSEISFDMLTVEVPAASIHEIIAQLQKDENLSFGFLTLIGAVHYPDSTDREFAVVYHLDSWKNNVRLRLKVFLPLSNPSVDSITDLFPCANWMERESYDFFGVIFNNHPDLRRILNEDSMDYFPLRKEYALEDGTREDKDDRFFGRD